MDHHLEGDGWGGFVCATRPVVIVHGDLSIVFWPGEIIDEDCVAWEAFHKLTVELYTSIPFEQWKFTLHPPSEVDAW